LIVSFFKMIGIRCNINTMSTLNVEIIIRNSLNASRETYSLAIFLWKK